MYPKFEFIKKLFQNVFFRLQNTQISIQKRPPYQACSPVKTVKYLTRWRQIRRIVVVDKSQIIFRIVIICFLQSNNVTEFHKTQTNNQNWNLRLSKSNAFRWRHRPFFHWPFHSFPVYWTFPNGKRQFWGSQNSLHFWETHFQNSELGTENQFKKFHFVYTLNSLWKSKKGEDRSGR